MADDERMTPWVIFPDSVSALSLCFDTLIGDMFMTYVVFLDASIAERPYPDGGSCPDSKVNVDLCSASS